MNEENLTFIDKVDYMGRHFDVYTDSRGNKYFWQVVPTTNGVQYLPPYMDDAVVLRAHYDEIKAANHAAIDERREKR